MSRISTYKLRTDEIIDKALREEDLLLSEIIHLLSLEAPQEVDLLFNAADRIRAGYVGKEVYLRGIVEFSNYCSRNCRYCGLRRDNRKISRYRISEDEIIRLALRIKESGCTTIVLQSGEDPFYSTDRMCHIIERIKQETALAVTLSIGERPYEDYLALRSNGADRYLLRHETASSLVYAMNHPDSSLEKRLECLGWLKEIGYEIGTGCLVGLPGQTLADLAEDILLFKEYDADMIGLGPFIPHDDTPLAGYHHGDMGLVLKMIALTRLVIKDCNIPATTAMEVLSPQSRKTAFRAGANVLMPVFTPAEYAAKYDIYPGKGAVSSKRTYLLSSYRDFFMELGRTIGVGYGFRQDNKRAAADQNKKTSMRGTKK